MRATAKDLRFHTKELLDAVDRGEEVVITHHGRPRAKLVAVTAPKTKQATTVPLQGIWKDHVESENVLDYVNRLRQGRGFDR